jgi:type IV pilus assembly protein PilN
MRLDINLATQPYEDARQFWMRWGTAVGVVGLLTLLLLTLTVSGWFHARRDHKAMAEKRALIAERDQVRANAEEFLNRPENRTTRDTSQFLNELIERKAFSWTRVLENLEKVMPARVHLVSINPGLDEDNQLSLKMTVAGDSRERAIELAQRMEDSKRFAQTNIMSGRSTQSTTGDTEQFDIAAIYIPEPATAADAGTVNPAKDATPKDATGAEGTAEPPPSKPKKAPAKPPIKAAPRSLAQGQGQGQQGANH